MKNTIIVCTILFVLMFQLISCKKEETNKKSNPVSEKKEITQVTDTIFDRKNPYYLFIKKNHPEVLNYEVSFFQEQDLDLDGQNEVIIAFSSNSHNHSDIENLFILKNDKGIMQELAYDFELKGDSYRINKVAIISIHDKKSSCIYFKVNEEDYGDGFFIYEVVGDKIKKVCKSASLGKNYNKFHDELIDSNNDGKYDGYTQTIGYNFFDKQNSFVLENSIFKLKKRDYLMNSYPENIFENPENVIYQFIGIMSLDYFNNTSKKRLDELCLDKTINKLPLSKLCWGNVYFNGKKEESIKITIDENEGIADAIGDFENLENKNKIKYQLKFALQKFNNKWQITKVEVIK